MSISWRLALRALGRDWRAGELRILAASIIVAVTAATSVAFFTDRVQRAMQLQASELLAADLVLSSRNPLVEDVVAAAREQGLRTARIVDFPSVVLVGEDTQLVQAKAVEQGYPLRGEFRLRSANGAVVTRDVPLPGEVWIEPQLGNRLGVEPGASVDLGKRRFRVSQLIDYEPDRGGEVFRLAPRIMLNYSDLESTGLVTSNSRVRYKLLMAGPLDRVASHRAWLEEHLQDGEEVQDVSNSRPELSTALDRARQHLSLAALVSILIAGAAIALAARHYAERQADASAIMRCLGAQQAAVLRIYCLRLLHVGLIASAVGCALGYLGQAVLASVLEGLFVQNIPPSGWKPAALGMLTGLVALLGFALPPVLRLGQVTPLRVLRRELGAAPPSAWLTLLLAAGTAAVLLIFYATNPAEAAKVLGGVVVLIIAFWIISRVLLRLVARLPHDFGLAWRYGINRLERNPGHSALQIVCYSVGLTALLILTITRADLLDEWRATLPDDAPNHFLVNVQQEEQQVLGDLFAQRGNERPTFYPIIHGRLTAIGDREVGPDDYSSDRAKRLISREFHLSWTTYMPSDNRVASGEWWGEEPGDTNAFSVEAGIAETLGIAMGDVLRYEIAGQELSAPVTSIREVDWDSFNANFFVIGSPALLGDLPATSIASVYIPAGEAEQSRVMTAVARQFPSVTVLDVGAILRQIRMIMDRASTAIEYVFVFALLAGVLVMYAAIQSSQNERKRETALLRALGGRRAQVLMGLVSEFLALGIIAGVLAAVAATLANYLLATYVFDMPYRVNPVLWAWALVGGGCGIGLAGIAGAWRFLNQSPMSVLRHS